MDFLDPHKRRVRKIELMIGYVLITILLGLGTLVLLYLSYGFGLGKNGQIIQNGLVFISSTPSSANIYVSGVQKGTTNARVILPSGQYLLQLQRSGYRVWSRAFNVDGGSVQHFDYPFLIPSKLTSKNSAIFASSPQLVLQSPNRRWLLVEQPGVIGEFYEFDLTHIAAAPIVVNIPPSLITPNTSPTQGLSLVQWSTDNQHVILARTTASGVEYILFDRQTPSDSVDLNTALSLSSTLTASLPPTSRPDAIQFWNNNYNQYYLYDASTLTLSTATLSDPTPQTVLTGVQSYTPYGSNLILYADGINAPASEAAVRLRDSGTTYNLTDLPSGSQYLLDLAQNNGNWYYAIGASNDSKVYVYENPEQNLQNQPDLPIVPVTILNVPQPDYVDFSADTQMILAESGTQFRVYDDFTNKVYDYNLSIPLDTPQKHATWMNGEQLTLVSGGKLVIFDYDDANQQTLNPASAEAGSYFDTNYKYVYTIAPNTDSATDATNPYALTNTALRTPADL